MNTVLVTSLRYPFSSAICLVEIQLRALACKESREVFEKHLNNKEQLG